ncbi:hypothetical protein GW17_00019911 [Ensete ventricosum]|nr:hypothetical protein GW17_00019911 [Ensete ventricosum]RZS23917.1 hypothetical protein BHM03_00056925 [Ensete ventricosum]
MKVKRNRQTSIVGSEEGPPSTKHRAVQVESNDAKRVRSSLAEETSVLTDAFPHFSRFKSDTRRQRPKDSHYLPLPNGYVVDVGGSIFLSHSLAGVNRDDEVDVTHRREAKPEMSSNKRMRNSLNLEK